MLNPIFIPNFIYRRMEQYCFEQFPNEACGLLIGNCSSIDAAAHFAPPPSPAMMINQMIPIPNIAVDPQRHFVMEPSALLPYLFNHTIKNHQNNSDPIIGMFHSHPNAAAIPSAEDLSSPWTHIPSHWIISLLDYHQPVCKAYLYSMDHSNGKKAYMPYTIHICYKDEVDK